VLAYKTRRKIINHSRQTRADDIIGKLTMAALDLELLMLQGRPAQIRPHFPGPTPSSGRGQPPRLFGVGERGGTKLPTASPARTAPVGRAPAPVVAQVVIEPRGSGTIKMTAGRGGRLVRFQDPELAAAVVKLREAKESGDGSEEADVTTDPQLFHYDGQGGCGAAHFQWFGPEAVPRRSGVVTVYALPHRSTWPQEPVHPVQPAFKSNLVSTVGTPLNPRPGRKINIFGRGESNGFEDYSSQIKYCVDTGDSLRPWTDDPRKPEVGISDHSVANICIRSSPVRQPTIDEIKRIGAPGCRVTYATDAKENEGVDFLRAEFIAKGLARKIEDGIGGGYRVIIFELN
jgi:hypothetical protein